MFVKSLLVVPHASIGIPTAERAGSSFVDATVGCMHARRLSPWKLGDIIENPLLQQDVERT